MPSVTLELPRDELERLDVWAMWTEGGDREAAVQALLDEWLEQQP